MDESVLARGDDPPEPPGCHPLGPAGRPSRLARLAPVLARGDDPPEPPGCHPLGPAGRPSRLARLAPVLARGDDPPEPPGCHPLGPAGRPSRLARLAPVLARGDDPPAFRTVWRRPPWLVPGGLMLILALLTVNVFAGGPLVGADRRIRAAVRAQATSGTWRWLSDSWHAPARLLVGLGSYQVAIPILAACALIAAARRRSLRPLLAAGAAVVLVLATVIPAKILIARPGPGLTSVGSGGLGVFPSGHATTAGACLGVAAALLLPDLPARIRPPAAAAVAGLCFGAGVALVWCDYHWLSDVVAGWALAALIAAASVRLSQCSRPRCLIPPWGHGRG